MTPKPMSTAPRDGTHFLAYLYHEPDSEGRGGHGEWREIWWKPWKDPVFGSQMSWHAGDDFDLKEEGQGVGDCHFGEAVPLCWLPLPRRSCWKGTRKSIRFSLEACQAEHEAMNQ